MQRNGNTWALLVGILTGAGSKEKSKKKNLKSDYHIIKQSHFLVYIWKKKKKRKKKWCQRGTYIQCSIVHNHQDTETM